MRTFKFEVTDTLDVTGIEGALESMADASKQLRDQNKESGVLIVTSHTQEDLAEAVTRQMTKSQLTDTERDRMRTYTNILIALVKQNGGSARLTQSELDETKGWGLHVGPKDGIMHLEVKSPKGLIHTM